MSKVIVNDRFREWRGDLDRIITESLIEAAAVGAETAKRTPTRYKIESIRDKIRVSPVFRDARGRAILIQDTDFRARFFESGTYQKFGRRLTARSKAGEAGNRGVRPAHYMRRGKTAARKSLQVLLQERLR
jgi:hypothetical protein